MLSTWTEDRVAELTRLYADGYSASLIAPILKLTRNAVLGKVHRLGLVSPEGKKRTNGVRAPRQPAKLHAPKIRIVPANANSNAMRVLGKTTHAEYRLRCVEIEPRNLSLMDLDTGDCRYPYGGDEDDDAKFCGHPAVAGSSYCRPHHDLCWVKPIPKKPRARVYAGPDFARSA